jgi:hypothetical protein
LKFVQYIGGKNVKDVISDWRFGITGCEHFGAIKSNKYEESPVWFESNSEVISGSDKACNWLRTVENISSIA